jgi:hypothetical protein
MILSLIFALSETLKVLSDILLLELVVRYQGQNDTDPFLFDEMVVTYKLPWGLLFILFRDEDIAFTGNSPPDVLPFHHVPCVEKDLEYGRRLAGSLNSFDIDDFDRILREFMEVLKNFRVA